MLTSHIIAIGMVISFLFTEIVGISPGGIIVPGYLAFHLTSPGRIVATFLTALITYALVRILSNFIIIFGRRRFMLAVSLGYLVGWALAIFPQVASLDLELRVIGYVIPGLIANDMIKQGVFKTSLAVIFVSIVVRLILLILI